MSQSPIRTNRHERSPIRSSHEDRHNKRYERSKSPIRKRRSSDKHHERSRSPKTRKHSPDNSSNKLIVTSLPPNIDRDSMNIILSQQNFNPIDVRVINKKNDFGGTLCFIEFQTVEEAKDYMRYTKGILRFDDCFESEIEYAQNVPAYIADLGSTDWTCVKCSMSNFSKRNSCFKCELDRQESESLESQGYKHVGSQPCDTLLVRELPMDTEEDQVLSEFSSKSNVKVHRVHISDSKKYCFVQLDSIEDAKRLLNTFNRKVPSINGCNLIVSFSLTSLNKILFAKDSITSKSQARVSIDKDSRETITTPLGTFPLCPKPDLDVLEKDKFSGYFYDSNTGFYFDPTTGFYFDDTLQIWRFWSTKFSAYIPVEGLEPEMREKLRLDEKKFYKVDIDGKVIEIPAVEIETMTIDEDEIQAEDPVEKPKTALDIRKEMDKWATEKANMSFTKQESITTTQEIQDEEQSNWSEEFRSIYGIYCLQIDFLLATLLF